MWQPEHPPSHSVASRGFWFIPSIYLSNPLFLFPRRDDVLQEAAVLTHLGDCLALVEERARGAHLHALPATGAAFGSAPGFSEIGNDQRSGASPAHIPGMRSFNLVADADTTRTQDAAIVIQPKPLVAGIDRKGREAVARSGYDRCPTTRPGSATRKRRPPRRPRRYDSVPTAAAPRSACDTRAASAYPCAPPFLPESG